MTLIVASVGTDHHPFTRLIDWLAEWQTSHPGVALVVQNGSNPPVPGARNAAMLPRPELLDLFARADACVLQGGPGGVMDARSQGLRPIVVPRDPAFGEHVDQHQIDFSHHLAQLDLAEIAQTSGQLFAMLDQTVSGDRTWRIDPATDVPAGVTAIEELLRQPPALRRGGWQRLRTMWGLHRGA